MHIQNPSKMKKFLSNIAAEAPLIASSCATPSDNKIQNAAHRGYWKCEEAMDAQNSVKALELAQKEGFWGSEFDVHITADSVLVVHHDNNWKKRNEDGTTERVIIWDRKYSDFDEYRLNNGETLPTLDEYLAQGEKCATTMLVFELKNQKDEQTENYMTDRAVEALKAHGLFDPSRVMFISFSQNICRKIADEYPEFTNQYLGDDLSPDEVHAMGINGVDYNYQVFYDHPDWYGQARANGMSVNVWTVNDTTVMKDMIDLGVDCITTNEPLLVRELLGEKEARSE